MNTGNRLMQFTNNLVDELIIPAGTPFAPGFDVIASAHRHHRSCKLKASPWHDYLQLRMGPHTHHATGEIHVLGIQVQAGTGGLFFIGMAVRLTLPRTPTMWFSTTRLQIEALNAAGQATTSGMITQVAASTETATLLESWSKTTPQVDGTVFALTNGGSPPNPTSHVRLI